MNVIASSPSKHYSPLRYPGGKAVLAKCIGEIIEKSKICNCEYIEPYAGGAGAALSLLIQEKVDSIVINDIDKSVYSFWWSILNRNRAFISKLENADISIEEWKIQKEIYQNSKTGKFERGFAFFYLNRANRSGIMTGGPIGGIEQNGKWKIDARFNKESLIKRIEDIYLYKNRISITNIDGIELLEKYKSKKNCFFYLDPPYVNKGSDLYYNHYTDLDHKKLAETLNNYTGNWLLSYDNTSLIRKIYSKRRHIYFDINYHADSYRVGKEILIFSDKLIA